MTSTASLKDRVVDATSRTKIGEVLEAEFGLDEELALKVAGRLSGGQSRMMNTLLFLQAKRDEGKLTQEQIQNLLADQDRFKLTGDQLNQQISKLLK